MAAMNKEELQEALRKHLKSLGRKGGNATLKKHGKAKMTKWGKLGGRPRKDKSK